MNKGRKETRLCQRTGTLVQTLIRSTKSGRNAEHITISVPERAEDRVYLYRQAILEGMSSDGQD